MTQKTKYFQVTAKCGHVGKLNYVPVNFAVCAESASEAAQRVRDYPRVKKQLKDAIIAVVEIDGNEYRSLLDTNRRDPYLKAKCHRDIDKDETFIERIVYAEAREQMEDKPFSMKYLYWKREGRYLPQRNRR